jgi:hypothetical protein
VPAWSYLRRIERVPRAASEPIEAEGLPPALIRDQKPLLPVHLLERVLEGGGMSVEEWCLELNRRSYFFVRPDPLKRLLRAYGDTEHDVLVIDARKLVDRYERAIALSAINTGAIQPAYAKRGHGAFLSIADYAAKANGAPAKPVAEITVSKPITDIQELTLRVERWCGPEHVGLVWERGRMA